MIDFSQHHDRASAAHRISVQHLEGQARRALEVQQEEFNEYLFSVNMSTSEIQRAELDELQARMAAIRSTQVRFFFYSAGNQHISTCS